ncbi:MAG: bifunctional demethylmenaquinone methyltransferase/2-methoxy-6-polyprenyl-1,4-benzoquinol methylase UbiE [Saprospiraceae bacterium]|nr:bifunctional demethylmenaquinone methyltransferase/2-methoxy-6-polyprenyl-1,4-benzoquinol methylase UbiE [Saprospiraceae bacterium]
MAEYKKVTPYENVVDSKKSQVTSMFDKVAPYYDFLNRLLSLRIDVLWRKKALRMLEKEQPKVILDIATGTADMAIMSTKIWSPEKIIGLDISKEMLRVGQTKIDKKNLANIISLENGDSENLHFEDESFDTVMAAFGVRNFENLEKGLSEMNRVLQKNGSCMILEFSKPRVFPLKQIFNIYFKYILPVIGKLTSKDPKAYEYLYKSVQVFPDYDNFASILKKTGFVDVTYKPLSFGICTIYLAKK